MIFTRESEESALIMQKQESQAGFSLFELLIAMSVMVILMGLASSLLASAFKMRIRENQRTEALADAQRGLNLMSREIANSGYALTDNGIVASDSGLTSIRIRGNLNASAKETTSNTTSDRDEDVKYFLYTDGGSSYIVRLDVNVGAQEMVLANTAVRDAAGNTMNEAQKSTAKYVVISVCVTLPAVGTPGSPGYEPASSVQLISDTSLRNADLVNY